MHARTLLKALPSLALDPKNRRASRPLVKTTTGVGMLGGRSLSASTLSASPSRCSRRMPERNTGLRTDSRIGCGSAAAPSIVLARATTLEAATASTRRADRWPGYAGVCLVPNTVSDQGRDRLPFVFEDRCTWDRQTSSRLGRHRRGSARPSTRPPGALP